MFQPYTNTLRLFSISSSHPSYDPLKSYFLPYCPESHNQFFHPSPLWKNDSFFTKLPFKLNEDINPTKATHPSMIPSDLRLAQEECSQLLKQGLIEPKDSGKKCLIIDYQPLNCFLKNDKFPLPKIQSLFVLIRDAKVFSKFDLKAGF